ncbi:MAG: hypothetical protein ABFS46_16430, partial [Myxococcota bacterium]
MDGRITMLRPWAATLLVGLCLTMPHRVSAQAPPEDPGVQVGNPSELDLEEVRRVIQITELGAEPPPDLRQRHISLEDAILAALQYNLSLQISRLDVDSASREVPATRARFHPVPGFNFVATDEKRVDPVRFSGEDLLPTTRL